LPKQVFLYTPFIRLTCTCIKQPELYPPIKKVATKTVVIALHPFDQAVCVLTCTFALLAFLEV
jgi:hypothetical protein